MDNIDDSENNAKVSDSAYSTSCNNSQSRRSHSSKSTYSGSNSSGSSGYGGKPSTSSGSNNLSQPSKKEKDSKKKKLTQADTITPEVPETDIRPTETTPVCPSSEELKDVVLTPVPALTPTDNGSENMDIASPSNNVEEEVITTIAPLNYATTNFDTNKSSYCSNGFSCVISMHDGVVMYTTSSLTTTLGFPKDMWIGRSFIDFIHPRDRNTFASQITNGLAVPKNVNELSPGSPLSTMVCRIRRYKGLTNSFGVKDRVVNFMPFLLKFSFKNICDEDGKVIYLVIQASPYFSAFKTSNELVTNAIPFVMRHTASGSMEYIDPESVPYLGYLPQDLVEKDALKLYHPEDLDYLQQVYETIVREGGMPRTKSYRMMAQNGDYLKLETEWSSFINPWSKRLEFVIGKHHIIEGPNNPDVFQSPKPEKFLAVSEESKIKALMFRENIIRIMNDVLTKPAEVAKQQMTKRCQDLASFMESLVEEEQPKVDEELRLDIQDADHSYYERDFVMLGGISPHHDNNDNKSSIGTPLSYNQLNYNETLQRYFASHIPYKGEDLDATSRENPVGTVDPEPMSRCGSGFSSCLSPILQNWSASIEQTSSCGSSAAAIGSPFLVSYGDQPLRLTESLISKHNTEMERELMKLHREGRASTNGEREKASNVSRQKKKEHLARCNASYQPVLTEASPSTENVYKKPHGVKRPSKHVESEAGAHKHHCPSSRQSRRRHTTSAAPVPSSSTITTTAASTPWPVNNMNAFILGVGVPPQMSIVSPMAPMPGMFQMYYTPATAATIPTSSDGTTLREGAAPNTSQTPTSGMPCMMYGQPVYGTPIVYTPIGAHMPYTVPQPMMTQNMQYHNSLNPLCLTTNNYEEACRVTFPARSRGRRRVKNSVEPNPGNVDHGSPESSSCSTIALKRASTAPQTNQNGKQSTVFSSDIRSSTNNFNSKSTEAVSDSTPTRNRKNLPGRAGHSEETIDRTDGESSYSSFYSSFFKTESGSAEDSGDGKKTNLNGIRKNNESQFTYQDPQSKVARRKMDPPWMDQVCVTSELVYKYQIMTKPLEDTLARDKQRMAELTQPSLVNEQLGQLYMDLQLEGVAARLTLEEGITSSSSSGEEMSTSTKVKQVRRKREYSKLLMIYEENAPMPPPNDDDDVSVSNLSVT